MMPGEFPVQPSNESLALAWLQLSMADPRTLTPDLLQLLAEFHNALNRRQRQDPYGIVSLTPPGPSYLQERYNLSRQHPVQPFQERFPAASFNAPFFGTDAQPKTGVRFEPEGTRWGI